MYALIMAGGAGSRFWPKSRIKKPKHLLSIVNEKTMLENTISRLENIIEPDNCYIVTNKEQKDNILRNIRDVKSENILEEPFARNTAAAIGYGALKLLTIDKEAVMIVLPADHYIKNVQKFARVINRAVEYCKKDPLSLVTIGIEPTHPETGYGYIQTGREISKGVREVRSFAEKPNFDTAVRFVNSGEFLWNSGIFIWRADTILKNIELHVPDLYDSLMEIRKMIGSSYSEKTFENIYSEMHSISIDYGVMENADNVKVLSGDFGWSDVGSWLEIYNLKEKDDKRNVVECERFISIDTEGCLISSDSKDKLIACIGLKDLSVIDTKDSLLITPLSRSQDVKEIVEMIKSVKHSDLL